MRKVFKTISSELVEFIPESHKNDPDLSRDAKDIKKRPLIFKIKKLSREDKYNLRSELKTDVREVESEETAVVVNIGSVARYVWENAIIEVHNVLLEDRELEVVKGEDKNALFNTSGMDTEIMEAIKFAQEISAFKDEEAKN